MGFFTIFFSDNSAPGLVLVEDFKNNSRWYHIGRKIAEIADFSANFGKIAEVISANIFFHKKCISDPIFCVESEKMVEVSRARRKIAENGYFWLFSAIFGYFRRIFEKQPNWSLVHKKWFTGLFLA